VYQFQSSPVPRDGCYVCWRHPRRGKCVSILTRPEGRVLRRWRPGRAQVRCGFNPHPSRGTGATENRLLDLPPHLQFQSSPVPRDGCYSLGSFSCFCASSFNPHPSRGTGATGCRYW